MVKGKVDLKKGRPKKANRHPLDNSEVVAHIRARGVALYNYKKNKLIDDWDHLKRSQLLRQVVKRVKAGKTEGLSRVLVEAVRRLIVALAKQAAIVDKIPKPIK